MASIPNSSQTKSENEITLELKIGSLPTHQKGWLSNTLYKYQGFWFERPFLDGIIQANQTFKPQPNDVLLATFQKSGTTWFTALLVTLMNRTRYDYNNPNHPLHKHSPVDFVRWIEFHHHDLNNSSSSSSLVKTHMPYTLLPECIKCSTNSCIVIYVCRNPLDVFVSAWDFYNKMRVKGCLSPLNIEEVFEMYCQGLIDNGPYWDHVLEYWNASIEKPNQVLFVRYEDVNAWDKMMILDRYEDMKTHPITSMKKLASFVGCPFTTKEEQNGVIEKIVEFCSFENLSTFQVNKDDEIEREDHCGLNVTNKLFFRKGKVGDYVNYLTDEMIQRLKEITLIKFKHTGLDVFA